jgi:spectinomycin phosphotransferase
VRDRPSDLPDAVVAEALASGWGIEVLSLEYAAVGAGSYHWRALDTRGRRWFVTADDLTWSGVSNAATADGIFADLRSAFETARALNDRGLAFVAAPLPSKNGGVIQRVLSNWSVTVFPVIDAIGTPTGEWQDAARRREAASLVGRLHRAAPPASIRRWSFEIPCRDVLEEALSDLDAPWTAGPYADETRSLLADSRTGVEGLLRLYDGLAEAMAQSDEPWVVTHGEPHGANFIDSRNGSDTTLHLIDWDTVRLAPRERDLAVVVADDADALVSYQSEAGPVTPSPEAMHLFHARWTLTDIATRVRWLRGPHGTSADDQRARAVLSLVLQPDRSSADACY